MENSKQKLVLVACGTGIATSTVVCERVENLIKKNGLNAKIIQCKISEVGGYEDQADLLVTTTIAPREYKMPVIKAMNYLTNINAEKTDQKIIEQLKK
ncbi:PTS sugar transporter subunit IIB [Clostridium tyrobutyricum]|jgi:PTS system galactitol-specific IIB component|uniref:PTS sugar transporter subunit IIB n=1 Tax=Clostridium tyrobutyricum TaxID=1519 RepID=UPI0002D7739E|nr:PTS sugar transporter subunit IIB [Clostridium tyrobutyricum]MBR9648954.1 PTS sugar transporter subunit IIB [Clostridium tyrobutyricum]MBV4421999.1 PTS sugar transporter subunit IIB [Clostridium tyrobutyricum]MBV4429209.1 PTS sugar transporter subunit IIB [Clostridium tyrobutyricum]MBV4438621.1 PTS sugar transporter subunit IIB [Clostridium tyrobutyricum]MBV4440921.1 PTS sugar transporter subunit IIB [Clostridium tyrobutyricum]